MLTLNNSGWLLDGQPTTVASWFPEGRIATINQDLTTEIEILISDILLLGNDFSVTGTTRSGMRIVNQSNIQILDLGIRDFSTGMELTGTNGISCMNMSLTNCAQGIRISSSQRSSMYRCTFTDCSEYGLRYISSDNNRITNCTFENMGFAGISMDACDNNGIVQNTFLNGTEAIEMLYNCSSNGIIDNIFTQNEFTIILFAGPTNNIIKDNVFTNDEVIAINLFQFCADNEVINNDLINSDMGIGVMEFSSRNSVNYNNIDVIQNGVINSDSDFTRIIGNTIKSRDGEGIMIISGNNLEIRDNMISSTMQSLDILMMSMLPEHLRPLVNNTERKTDS